MFDFSDLFQWERFITPQIIKIFYWLAFGIAVMTGVLAIITGLWMIPISPFSGLITILLGVLGTAAGIVFARIAAEFILIVFRISEHLGAIRQRGEM